MKLPFKRTDLGKAFELRLQIYEILLPERRKKLPCAGNNAELYFFFWLAARRRENSRHCWVSTLMLDCKFLELQEGIQVPAIDCYLIQVSLNLNTIEPKMRGNYEYIKKLIFYFTENSSFPLQNPVG
jgi:hypothetical protein